MDVISIPAGAEPVARRNGVVAASLLAVGSTLATCFASASPANDQIQQFVGFAAACLAPLTAAILTRNSPSWVRRTAPALAKLLLGPPMGGDVQQVFINAAIIFVLTGWLLEALKITREASPATDGLSRKIIAGSLLLAAAPFAMLSFMPTINENLPLFLCCFAAIAFAIPASLGWVCARLMIFVERRGIPAIRHCRAEYLRAQEVGK